MPGIGLPHPIELVVADSWSTGNGNNIGSIIGLMLNGWLQSRYGSRKVYMGAMALMGVTIFALFFAVNVQMLFAANILCGIPWGIFQTLTTAYAAEICPAAMRGYLTAWVSMCWGCGSFLAAGVLRASLDLDGDLGWKLPYALQWVWVVPLFFAALFSPESPWYLVRWGRVADAEKSLRRLARKDLYTEQSMKETLALMIHTNEMEKLESADASFKDCFRGTNLRRTGIVVSSHSANFRCPTSRPPYDTPFHRKISNANPLFLSVWPGSSRFSTASLLHHLQPSCKPHARSRMLYIYVKLTKG